MTNQILERLRYLRNWELVNVILIPASVIFLFLTGVFDWQGFGVSTQIALGLVSFILLQGGYYWHIKLRSVQARARQLTPTFERTFRYLKWVNLCLLIAYPLLVYGVLQPHPSEFWWASCLYILAVLEYINYFEFQLMHDTENDWRFLLKHRRLRRAPLAVDLRLAKTKVP